MKKYYDIHPLPLDNRQTRDPYEELVAMVGPNKKIITIGENGADIFQNGDNNE